MTIVEQSAQLIYPATREDAAVELKLVEEAGRNCWRSEGKITNDSYLPFIQGLIKRGHETPLEFARFIFKLYTSRDVMAELTRHRLASFCIESQRYVNGLGGEGSGIKVIRPEFIPENSILYLSTTECDIIKEDMGIREYAAGINWIRAMESAEDAYISMMREGMKNQDARKVLPNSTATTIYMSCNLRELMHILELRDSSAAYPEMRKLMRLVRAELVKVLPELFSKEDSAHE